MFFCDQQIAPGFDPRTTDEQKDILMRDFDHIGLPTDVKRPNEMWVESTRVWVTSPADSPDMIEYLRYEPTAPSPGRCARSRTWLFVWKTWTGRSKEKM